MALVLWGGADCLDKFGVDWC